MSRVARREGEQSMSLGTDAADAVAADAASTSASRGAADRLHPVARSLGPALLILLAQVVVFPAPGAIMLRGLIVGGLTALVALGMALVYRANRNRQLRSGRPRL